MERYALFRAGQETGYVSGLEIDIEPESLTVDRYIVLQDGARWEGGKLAVSLGELRARQEWKDACTWMIAFGGENGHISPKTSPGTAHLINVTAENFAGRRDRRMFKALHPDLHPGCVIFVPFASCDFTQMYYQASLQDKNAVFRSNRTFVEHVAQGFGPGTGPRLESVDFFPTLELDVPDKVAGDAWLEGTARAFFDGKPLDGVTVEVSLDCLGGYLPQTRLRVGGDPVPFRLLALGLSGGDTICLRAGFRYRSSVTERLITVN